MDNTIFESVYDTYAAMLYRLALDVSFTKTEADEILFNTFRKFYEQSGIIQKGQSLCIVLVNLLIKTAQEQSGADKLTNSLQLKQFKSTPLLQEIVFRQISLLDYWKEKKLTETQGLEMLWQEFNLIKHN